MTVKIKPIFELFFVANRLVCLLCFFVSIKKRFLFEGDLRCFFLKHGRSQRGGGHGSHAPPHQSILDKSKDLGNYDKHLPLRDCFLAGLLISWLTKEKYNTTLLFALARVVMAQPQWPGNGQASLQ